MRTRDYRRHNDWRKAIRKRNIVRNVYDMADWSDNLHQYSKNKVHCSCPLCRGKIKNKQICGPAESWPIQAQKQFVDMDQQTEEYITDKQSGG